MKFKILTISAWLSVMLISTSAFSQSIDVTSLTGMNLFPKRKAQQYTPHLWLTAAYGKEFKFGFTAFTNTDCFERSWPERGSYRQIRKHSGGGLYMAVSPMNDSKLRPEFFVSFGLSTHTWKVESVNSYLEESVLSREDLQSAFFMSGVRLRYEFKPWLHAIAGLSLGENNVQLGLRYTYGS